MAYNIDDMYTASFRNVQFLTENISESGGQKVVIHEFVNSNRRKVESLGTLQPTLKVTALLHGANYIDDLRQLKRAMTKKGVGEYIHAFEGRKLVHPVSYNVVQTEKKLGQAIITLEFSEEPLNLSNPNALPTTLAVVASNVKAAAANVDASSEAAVADNFEVRTDFSGVFKNGLDAVRAVSRQFQVALSKVNAAADQITEVQGVIDAFNRDLAGLLSTPSIMASRLTGLQTSLREVISTPQRMFDIQAGLFNSVLGLDLGSNDEQKRNSYTVKTWVQASAFAEMCSALSDFDFVTTLDIEDAEADLKNYYDELTENDQTHVITQDLRELLDTLNANVQAYINNQAINTPNTFVVDTPPVPLQELLYRYYGNTENIDEIIALNNISDIAEVSGEIILVTVQ